MTEVAFADGGIVVQRGIAGELVMLQAVYDHGRLVAWHANLRVREGPRGGASSKCSVSLPAAREHLERLGVHLGWHGALSLDAIITDDGPSYIDINPRLVEPGNAWRAGVDLVGALIDISLGDQPAALAPSQPDVRTHQVLLAVLSAAHGGRVRLAGELVRAPARRGSFRRSTEELTPFGHDPLTLVPLAAAVLVTLARPSSAAWFSDGAVANYALTPAAWRAIQGDSHAIRG